jgi:ribonucleoside-diphosphate reductase alpha chain
VFIIEDTCESWANSQSALVASFMDCSNIDSRFSKYSGYEIEFDYSRIRPKGAPLSFSGKAPGSDVLRSSHENITKQIQKYIDAGEFDAFRTSALPAVHCLLMAMDAVMSGGVRRTASIILLSPDDLPAVKCKMGNWFVENPHLKNANFSVLLNRSTTTLEQFNRYKEYVKDFGEPGFIWVDSNDSCFNPCGEISMCPKVSKKMLLKVFNELSYENQNRIMGRIPQSFWDAQEDKYFTGWSVCNLSSINGSKCNTEEKFYNQIFIILDCHLKRCFYGT